MNTDFIIGFEPETESTILIPGGNLDEVNSCILRDRMKDLVNEGHSRIIVDMCHVSFVGSAGLGIFVSTSVVLNKKRGRFCLVNVNEGIKKILTIANLYSKIDVYESREAALAAWHE